MKKLISILSAIFLVSFSFAQTSAVTTTTVNLRDAPIVSGSNIVSAIPQGTAIEIKNCKGDWCETTYEDVTGYVNRNYVKATSPNEIKTTAIPTSPVHYYTNTNGNKVQSPTKYTAQPAGATAKCRDGSYSFSQSHRGTCSHHGGVAVWLSK